MSKLGIVRLEGIAVLNVKPRYPTSLISRVSEGLALHNSNRIAIEALASQKHTYFFLYSVVQTLEQASALGVRTEIIR